MSDYTKQMAVLIEQFIEATIAGDDEAARAVSLLISQAQMKHDDEQTEEVPQVRSEINT